MHLVLLQFLHLVPTRLRVVEGRALVVAVSVRVVCVFWLCCGCLVVAVCGRVFCYLAVRREDCVTEAMK